MTNWQKIVQGGSVQFSANLRMAGVVVPRLNAHAVGK
jgi:hypothetical protein